ncbi:MAG TPA: calcium-binding protein [Tepidisphaeraceae bacterium]|jgi:Ca2+-binding RTX toxin-like protein|nr:calcium-binding protein [Tepidisphaeraceae bacterium]
MRDSHRGVVADAIKPVVEPLESRRMLSASLASSGLLKITGTTGNDTITVGIDPANSAKILVNDGVGNSRFSKTAVKSISIIAGDGADNITINTGIKQQITIKAGEGDDVIHGGSGREIIVGGAGADQIFGGGGSDQVFGGDGNDTISGGSSNDYLYGDGGNDVINGDSGNDVLAGDFEDTLVFSGAAPRVEGNDSLNGGDGNDWLLGERRYLGTGVDFAGDGQDTFTGGAGDDVIDINKDGNDTITDEQTGDFVPLNEVAHAEENQPGDVHQHVILRIKVRSGSKYKNVVVPANVGAMQPGFFALLHTHDTTGQIHFEAGPPNTTFMLQDFFRIWGISMDKNHVGRFIPPAGKKVTMFVRRGASTKLVNGKWVSSGGTTFQTTKFGAFVPIGDAATGQGTSPPTHGDIIEIRVG